jgi:hypothetical protein
LGSLCGRGQSDFSPPDYTHSFAQTGIVQSISPGSISRAIVDDDQFEFVVFLRRILSMDRACVVAVVDR